MSMLDLQESLNASAREIAAWERGDAYPPYAMAQQLARVLRIPFGFLFLSKPPSDDPPLPDLRTRGEQKPEKASPDLIEVLNDVLRRQEWYREYAEENGMKPLRFVRSYQMSAGADTIAANIRATLGINEQLRRSCSSWDAYLTQLTRQAEAAGILVMRSGVVKHDTTRPLSADEFQGFALSDELAPVIFINVRDTRAARIFTFAHEAAHLWIGESGISSPNRLLETISAAARIEGFCHAVAAETLVPRGEFSPLWKDTEPFMGMTERLARHFWVSAIVILRRAFELGLLNRPEFFGLLQEARRRQKPPRTEDGGNFFLTIPSRNSAKFTDSVLGALRERRLLHTDAGALLSISQSTLLELANRRLGA